ncbi:MAG TPA: response regulator transcription factor, partial [Agriterribacter sp.]|nr:response regulator transcription factor [Agriterribacter sp.]
MIKVLIADDHAEIRSAWAFFLQSQENIAVVGECADGQQTINKVKELQPDIVLMDINMKYVSGIEATATISAKFPEVRVICVSSHTSSIYIKKMMAAGARGYVFKHAVAEDLVTA